MVPEPANDPVVEVQDLWVRLGGDAVLQGVNLRVARGALHALIGPNGGGKTTLVQSMLGQVPFAGSVRLHWRGSGNIGYVPQRLALDPFLPLTVRDFLALGIQRKPLALGSGRRLRARCDAALEELGVRDRARRRLGDLSGGERQRVLLAQALLPEPELLLLDEPFSGVDPPAQEAIEKLLGKLRSRGVTLLLVTHDLPLVLRLADQVTGLSRCVSFAGRPAEVLTGERLLPSFPPVGSDA